MIIFVQEPSMLEILSPITASGTALDFHKIPITMYLF